MRLRASPRPVERFGTALVDREADRGEDAVAVLASRLAEAHERRKAAAGGAACEVIDQGADVVDRQAGGEERSEGFLERVRAPRVTARLLELAGGGLFVGEVLGAFELHPAGVFERLAASWSPS
jgi:hypothetical protein